MSLIRTGFLAVAMAIAALCVIHLSSRSQVHAQDGDTSQDTDGPPIDEAGVEATSADPPQPFKLYSADDGAVSCDALSDADKATSDQIQEWAEADSGYQVHQEWAAGSKWAREHARLVIAERVAGLEGSGEVGIE